MSPPSTPPCPECSTHGAWALTYKQVTRYCMCGKLGPKPPEGQRLYFKFMVAPLHIAAHDRASNHHKQVMASETCGCFYCLKTFKPAEIVEWIDAGRTALCPKCGIDSVLGSAEGIPLTHEFLSKMEKHWFGMQLQKKETP